MPSRKQLMMTSPFERERLPLLDRAGAPGASDELPAYADVLAAYHRAHAADLQAMLDGLPLRPGQRVLDVACGDGAYTCWMAQRVGPAGRVEAIDLSQAYLSVADARARAEGLADRVRLHLGAGQALPFADNQFDLVWCAQSMYTLPDPRAALAEMARVALPGGSVAIFENDLLHYILLPWPRALGQALDHAQRMALAGADGAAEGQRVVGNLCGALAQAGLASCRLTISTIIHRGPFGDDERRYLGWHLDDLRDRARPRLDDAMLDLFDRLTLPDSAGYLLSRPEITAVYINLVALGVKPGNRGR
jgi:SAM-dependent methyltransferase